MNIYKRHTPVIVKHFSGEWEIMTLERAIRKVGVREWCDNAHISNSRDIDIMFAGIKSVNSDFDFRWVTLNGFYMVHHGTHMATYVSAIFSIQTLNGTVITREELLGLARDWKLREEDERVRRQNRRKGSRSRIRFRAFGYRKVRTQNERKQNIAVKDDGEPDVRGHRKNLPSAWDDIPRRDENGWKSQGKKRKQWM